MKKLISIIAAALMLMTMLTFTGAAANDLFDVTFIEGSNIFVVTAGSGLTGTNTVALVVKDSAGNEVYMDALNAIKPDKLHMAVNLGAGLEAATYTFTFTSSGDVNNSQTKTCTATAQGGSGEEPVYGDTFFNVIYDSQQYAFVVSGEITKAGGKPAYTRIALLVYEPEENGQSDLYYMDALNEHSGPFTFIVPVEPTAPGGTYTFIVSSNGDVVTADTMSCGINDNFETYGTIDKGSTIGAKYTLRDGEESRMVIIAVYNEDGGVAYVKIARTAVNGKVTAEIKFGKDEETAGYSAMAFVWGSFETLRPIKSARSFR